MRGAAPALVWLLWDGPDPANDDCMDELDGKVDMDCFGGGGRVAGGGGVDMTAGDDCVVEAAHCDDDKDPKLTSLDGALLRGGRPR